MTPDLPWPGAPVAHRVHSGGGSVGVLRGVEGGVWREGGEARLLSRLYISSRCSAHPRGEQGHTQCPCPTHSRLTHRETPGPGSTPRAWNGTRSFLRWPGTGSPVPGGGGLPEGGARPLPGDARGRGRAQSVEDVSGTQARLCRVPPRAVRRPAWNSLPNKHAGQPPGKSSSGSAGHWGPQWPATVIQ